MELHENLKSLRKQNKLTKTELCKRLDLPFSTYNNWEIKNSAPSIPHLCMLADFYGVSVDYLVGHNIKENHITKIQSDLLQKYGKLSYNERRLVNILINGINEMKDEKELSDISAVLSYVSLTRKIPLFNQSASAGFGVYLENADAEMMSILDIPEYREADMAIRVNGDSMTPEYNDGDIVLVSQQPFVDIGMPTDIVDSPDSPLYPEYKDLIEAELDGIVDRLHMIQELPIPGVDGLEDWDDLSWLDNRQIISCYPSTCGFFMMQIEILKKFDRLDFSIPVELL